MEAKPLNELRVNELRIALEKRSLDKSGTKAVLMQRLEQAIRNDGGDPRSYTFDVRDLRTNGALNLSDDSDGKNEAELNPNGEDPANSDSASVIATPSIITENADDERTTNDNTKFEPSESVHGSDEISRPSSRTLLLGMNVQTKMEVIADETATSVNSDVVICPAPSTNQQHQTINHPMEMDTEKSVTPKPVESTSQPATKATSSTAAAAPLPMECNQTPPSSDLSHSLWVRNISTTTKAADLKALFSTYAKVVKAKIFTAKNKSTLTIFGYVIMIDEPSADLCVTKLNSSNFKGRVISVEKALGSTLSSGKKTVPAGEVKTNKESDEKAPKKDDSTPKSSNKDARNDASSSKPKSKPRPMITAARPSKIIERKTEHRVTSRVTRSRSGGFPASRFVTSSSRYSSAYRRPLIESAPQRFASRTFERSTFQRPPAYGSTRGSTRGRAPLRVSSRYDRERIPELREFAQPPSPPARQHLGSSSSATSEKGEMLRYKEEMKRREEEHKRREEELRLQRERERIKYEREKLAREKLEVQQMKLLASAQFSAQFMQQQPHSGIQPLLAPPAAHHHHQQQQQQIPKDSSQSSSRRDTSTSEKSRQKSGDKSRKSDAPKTNKSRNTDSRQQDTRSSAAINRQNRSPPRPSFINKSGSRSRSPIFSRPTNNPRERNSREHNTFEAGGRRPTYEGEEHVTGRKQSPPSGRRGTTSQGYREFSKDSRIQSGPPQQPYGNQQNFGQQQQQTGFANAKRYNNDSRQQQHDHSLPRNYQRQSGVDRRRGGEGNEGRIYSEGIGRHSETVGEFAPRTDPSYASRMLGDSSRLPDSFSAEEMFNPMGGTSDLPRSGYSATTVSNLYHQNPQSYPSGNSGTSNWNTNESRSRGFGSGRFDDSGKQSSSQYADNSFQRGNQGWNAADNPSSSSSYRNDKHGPNYYQGTNRRYPL